MLSIRIHKCPSCDGKHDQVDCHEYAVRRAAWTHWYTCPSTGDPVSVLVEVEGGKLYEIDPAIIETLMQARKAGKFVVAVFRQEQAGENLWNTHCVQHPYDFPTDHFATCVNLLREAFDKVAGPPPKADEPMRRATPKPTLWNPVAVPRVQTIKDLQRGVDLNTTAANLGRIVQADAADSPVVVEDQDDEEEDREDERE